MKAFAFVFRLYILPCTVACVVDAAVAKHIGTTPAANGAVLWQKKPARLVVSVAAESGSFFRSPLLLYSMEQCTFSQSSSVLPPPPRHPLIRAAREWRAEAAATLTARDDGARIVALALIIVATSTSLSSILCLPLSKTDSAHFPFFVPTPTK